MNLMFHKCSLQISKGEAKGAKKSLQWLRGKKYDHEKEIEEILIFQKTQEVTGYKAFFREKVNRKALFIASILFVGAEFTGMNAFLFYTTSIFQVSHLHIKSALFIIFSRLQEASIGITPGLASVFAGICTFSGPPLALLLVDRAGRKALLIISLVTMFICLIVMGTYFQMQSHNAESVKSWRIVPVVVLCLFIFINSFGCFPIAFVVLGEIFAQSVKDVAAGITMTISGIAASIITIGFPYLTDAIGNGGVFFLFAGCTALTFLFVLFAIPETKGKSFAEIQLLLSYKIL